MSLEVLGRKKNLTEEDKELFYSAMGKGMIKLAEEKNRKKNIVWLEKVIIFDNSEQHSLWTKRYHAQFNKNIVILESLNKWNPFKKTTIKYLQKHFVEQEIEL